MVVDCGATCAKYILCLFNFIFFVIGSAVLCVGIWLAVDKTSFIHLTHFNTMNESVEIQNKARGIIRELTEPTVIEQGAYILIAAGAFIFIISFLGYCGAIKESRVLLTAYGLFIVIIALLQIASIALAAFYKDKAETHTKEFFLHTIRKYYTTIDRKDAVTLSWDFMMAELRCCGVHNSVDFQVASEFVKYTNEKGDGQIVPEACCKLHSNHDLAVFKPVDDNCIYAPTTSNSYMQKGCYDTVYDFLISHLNVVIGVAVAVIAVQILGIIFAFCLCKAVGNERDFHYKY
jgi:tetraspanin-18